MKIVNKFFGVFLLLLPYSLLSQNITHVYQSATDKLIFFDNNLYVQKRNCMLNHINYPAQTVLSKGGYSENRSNYFLFTVADSLQVQALETKINNYDSLIIEVTSNGDRFAQATYLSSYFYSINIGIEDSTYNFIVFSSNDYNPKPNMNDRIRLTVYKPHDFVVHTININILPCSFCPYKNTLNNVAYTYTAKDKLSNYFFFDFLSIDYFYFTYQHFLGEQAVKKGRNRLKFCGKLYQEIKK